mmetsp:Transcript_13140/g.21479  ORF Transcript_13140/g.21479 Transcript_13140/m.21479 type:complete len:171 (-) Transcript_13140:46-558(-)|eukprot:CAMPEP_0196168950 /NCGR_PEP_ID=MMETSP0911-20130528/3594_1 /TAXON_ID=49265 /ORGANISM="Thalassiosira rotula, Strain GSO102" /LENGTH=170 /DNA_ID=CAMNT_0041435087 /DNA_START=90 /DNA_END=602 /DNA_ORIENTATION=+
MTRLILQVIIILASLHRSHGLLNFAVPPRGTSGTFGTTRTTFSSALGATRKEADNKKELDDEDSYSPAPWEAELHYQINKRRLENAWVNKMMKSKTRFLPYTQCSEWAKRQNMWVDRKEWKDWISMGEGKPSLVPSDPERFYTNQGTWVSWEDFLGVESIDPNSMGGAGI